MNHLAHLLLAQHSGGDRIGALLGDFVKGDPSREFSGEWLRGIRLHRAVDRFTDDHALTRTSRERFQPRYRRYAGVLLDLYYDHFLVRHWSTFADQPLPRFAASVHAEIAAVKARLPEPLQRFTDFMAAERLLERYGEVPLILEVARRMSGRLSRPNDLGDAAGELVRLYADLETDFLAFFPCAIRFAQGWDE